MSGCTWTWAQNTVPAREWAAHLTLTEACERWYDYDDLAEAIDIVIDYTANRASAGERAKCIEEVRDWRNRQLQIADEKDADAPCSAEMHRICAAAALRVAAALTLKKEEDASHS